MLTSIGRIYLFINGDVFFTVDNLLLITLTVERSVESNNKSFLGKPLFT